MNILTQRFLVGANVATLIALLIAVIHFRQNDVSVSDRMAITEAVAQYSYLWDSKDATGFSNLFTEDAVVERWTLGKLISRLEGRPAIFQYAKEAHTKRVADRQTRHHMTGLVFIELTKDSALTENMVLITHQTDQEPAAHIANAGVYRITWRKTDREWQIAKRLLFSDSSIVK